ncbi:hypothetical protein FOZ61_008979 [Perkinsus olseni]|uniref:Peptidase A1 domain-containing protein n=1 Tax=Perkinsus olseni TaxID=32597 RepID=A0A7J6L2T3_PEROL|nr:hypothetical protein FOZ61_008979 [Perkinsus olseni]KAF4655132.1 hypothetical protein FOL46_008383 [Perkinsus olseni]
MVSSLTFAIYLGRPSAGSFKSNGELLLGGGDEALYVKPLRFVRFTNPAELKVRLRSLQVGDGAFPHAINHDLLIDTGTNFLIAPRQYRDFLVKEIEFQASVRARTAVRIVWDPNFKEYVFDCAYAVHLPTITFILGSGDVLLTIHPAAYSNEITNTCWIAITPSCDGSWILPDKTLFGNYLELQPQNARVGIAKLK